MAGTAFALAALVLYAATTLLTRLATDSADSDLGLLLVMVVTAVCAGGLLLLQAATGRSPGAFPPIAVLTFCAAGVFSAFLGRWLLFEAVVRLGAARASAFQTSSPVFTALFGWAILADRPSAGALAAMILTLGGLALVADQPARGPRTVAGALASSLPRASEAHPDGPPWSTRRLLVLGLSSAASYALGNICRAYGVRLWNEPLWGVFLGAATGLGLHLLMSARQSPSKLIRRLLDANRHGMRLFLVVGVSGLAAQICTIVAMRNLPVAEVAAIMTGTPLLVYPVSYLFMRRSEALTAYSAAGLALALGGIGFLVVRPLIAG